MLWTVAYGKGGVCHTTLGHGVEARAEPAFLIPFPRGTEWTASGKAVQ
jgi:type 1 glutamine amidotransferase